MKMQWVGCRLIKVHTGMPLKVPRLFLSASEEMRVTHGPDARRGPNLEHIHAGDGRAIDHPCFDASRRTPTLEQMDALYFERGLDSKFSHYDRRSPC